MIAPLSSLRTLGLASLRAAMIALHHLSIPPDLGEHPLMRKPVVSYLSQCFH